MPFTEGRVRWAVVIAAVAGLALPFEAAAPALASPAPSWPVFPCQAGEHFLPPVAQPTW